MGSGKRICLLTEKMQETWFPSLGWGDLLEMEMAIQSIVLPGEYHGQSSLVGYSPWGHKESDTTGGACNPQ